MRRLTAGPILALLLTAAPSFAGVCTVPGSHPTIQEAVDDPSCSSITLLAQTYPESVIIFRSLSLSGPVAGGAVVEGQMRVRGSGTSVDLDDLLLRSGCPQGLDVGGSAEVVGANVEVELSTPLPCPVSMIFGDGFESGDTSAWSATVP